jgi:hypothetical protein
MLPLMTARAGGILVFSTSCEPNQNPKTTTIIKATAATVLKYSFCQSFLPVVVKLCLLPNYGGSTSILRLIFLSLSLAHLRLPISSLAFRLIWENHKLGSQNNGFCCVWGLFSIRIPLSQTKLSRPHMQPHRWKKQTPPSQLFCYSCFLK